MNYIIKKIAYFFSLVLTVGAVFGLFAPTVFAANISLQAPVPTLRAANYSDCPSCVNWNEEGPTHATGDADSRPIIALGIAYRNNSSIIANNVTVRLSPQSGNGGTTTFTGKVWADNAPQISGNATVTIPAGQTLEFTGEVFFYPNGSSNPIPTNNDSMIFSGISVGDVSPGQYGGVVAHFRVQGDTTPPPPPPPEYSLDVNTLVATEVTETSAKLRGESRTAGTASEVWFEYATNANDLSSNGNGSQGASTTSHYSQGASFQWLSHFRTVNGLQPHTTYFYQVCAETGNLVACDPYESFTTLGTIIIENPPIQIDTLSEQAVSEDSATLRGQVVEDEDGNVNTWFEYSTNQSTVSNGSGQVVTVSGTFSQGSIFSRNLSGLSSNTTYYYRACGRDQNNHQDCGSLDNFITNNIVINNLPIQIDTLSAQNEDENSALLRGEVVEEEDGNVSTWFEYGINQSTVSNGNGSTLSVSGTYNQGNTFTRTLTGLDDNTTYYFRACGEDQNNNQDCGSVENFITNTVSGGNDPDVTTDSPDNVDTDSAELNGEYDMNDFTDGDIFFVWSDNDNDLDDVENEDNINDVEDFAEVEIIDQGVDGSDNVSETIHGLDQGTTYYYRLCVLYNDENGDDVITCGSTREFTTDEEEVIPETNDKPIPQVCVPENIGMTSASLVARVNGNGLATNSYFQYGTSTAFGISTGTSATGTGTGTITKFISNLSSNTTYYCRAVATNGDGTSYGDIGIFKTLPLPNVTPDRPITVVSSGGAGSYIFLEIDDNQETAARGQTLQYDVEWRNTSGRDLDDVVLNIRLPKSVAFLSSTDGRYNKRDHQVTIDIGSLDKGEEDQMTITTQVRGGTEGDQLVAEAIIAFEDPQPNSGGLLSAIEYDVDTYTNGASGLLAGLFGIGLLPGLIGLLLATLLILIIVLVARRLTDPRRTEYRG